jgi:hydrogenase nickel incorporation protein HypB
MEMKVLHQILDANETMAQHNRQLFAEKNVFVLNMMSSPGSGKTTLLKRMLQELKPHDVKTAVVVGDISTTNDAERLTGTGAPVIQINTDQFGGDGHLAAHIIEKAVSQIALDEVDLLIVENVGNLVNPAMFDIGEDMRVVILSVTEGEDKPLKYPQMFRVCDVTLINKIDLLPYLDYRMEAVHHHIHEIHPEMSIFEISSKTGKGVNAWLEWLKTGMDQKIMKKGPQNG